jgi:hypothetical protein
MTKKMRSVKASIVTGLVIISTLVTLFPPTSAGLIFNLQSVLNVTWGNEIDEPIIPRGEIRSLTLVITHKIARGPAGEAVLVTLEGSLIPIHVSIIDTPSWCTATLSQGTLSVIVQSNQISTVETTLSISVANDAPAYGLGYIKVKATAETTGLIEGCENEFTLSFLPEYKALIEPSYPESYSKDIGPMDTAVFPIEIENLGNARTIVFLNVSNIPKDWIAMVTDQLTIAEGAGSKGTAYLIVKPSKSFGYHNEEGTIRVSMQPVKADDYSKKGEITTQTFLVQSRGFSTPGFETIFFLSAFALVFLIISFTRKRKK